MTAPAREIAIPPGFARSAPAAADYDAEELRAALAVAHAACDRARGEILPRFRNVGAQQKSDGSPVTEADLAAERAMRETIEAAFPEDSILGEEFGADERGAQRRWILDPIDGTIAFSRGIPLFTTLVALTIDDVPVLGVIDLPATADRIAGFAGGGITRGESAGSGTPVRVRPPVRLEDALICHGDLFCFDLAGLRPAYDALATRVRTLRGYTDAFGHLLVLSGAADAMIDCDLNPWDAAVTRVLAQEAGGVCLAREREGGQKIDLIFGEAGAVEAIGETIPR